MIDAWLEPDDEDEFEYRSNNIDDSCLDDDCDDRAYTVSTHNYECRLYDEDNRRMRWRP